MPYLFHSPRPARTPFIASKTFALPLCFTIENINPVNPEAIEANVVPTPDRAANSHFPPARPKEVPELKAIQPHQMVKRPVIKATPSLIGRGFVPLSKRPMRGLMNHAPTKAEKKGLYVMR